jgi:hypothetical protein
MITKKYTPFCDHFKRGRCSKCEAIRKKIKEGDKLSHPFEKHPPLLEWRRGETMEDIWKEVRQARLKDLGVTEREVKKDKRGRQYVELSGFYPAPEKLIVELRELQSLVAFKRSVRA